MRVAIYVTALVIIAPMVATFIIMYQVDWFNSLLTPECFAKEGLEIVIGQNRLMNLNFAVCLILVLLVFLGSILLSHRIAGPFEKLKSYLKLLGTGQWGLRMSLRKNDYFRELADDFNQLAERLDQRMSQLRGHLESAKQNATGEVRTEIEAALALCQAKDNSK